MDARSSVRSVEAKVNSSIASSSSLYSSRNELIPPSLRKLVSLTCDVAYKSTPPIELSSYEVMSLPINSKMHPANIKNDKAITNIMAVFVFLPSCDYKFLFMILCMTLSLGRQHMKPAMRSF